MRNGGRAAISQEIRLAYFSLSLRERAGVRATYRT
jgi:hypothetical protein